MSANSGSEIQYTPEQQQQHNINNAYATFKHNAAIALLVGAPILIAIPPRKLDLYTFSLVGAAFVSANHLNREKTGKSFLQQFGYEYVRKKESQQREQSQVRISDLNLATMDPANRPGSLLEKETRKSPNGTHEVDWKEKRLQEEQEKLDNGEGYADMIVDQIWDVWNQKGRKGNDTKD